jgi:hypothetical protein
MRYLLKTKEKMLKSMMMKIIMIKKEANLMIKLVKIMMMIMIIKKMKSLMRKCSNHQQK